MALWLYAVLSFLIDASVNAQPWDYTYYRALDYDGKYVLGWRYNATDIEFEVSVQTLGYIGFGLSKNGEMYPADMVIGWINGGQMYLGDYYTTGADRTPYMDKRQDWVVQEGNQQNGTTILRFSRKLDTCDPNDKPITPDRMTVIWSYHENDPDVTSGMVPYHGPTNRGSRSIFLLNDDVIPRKMPTSDSLFMIDFTNYDYTIPTAGSIQQCRVFQKDAIPKGHMIKFEPMITPGNEAYVYRMAFYRCDMNGANLAGQIYDCDTAPVQVKSCKTTVVTWSMGGEAFHFPEGVGMSLGATGDPADYVLEIHYSKFEDAIGADGAPIVIPDNSGIRITYTTEPVSHNAAMVEIGKVVSPGWKQIVLDKEPAFTATSYCSPRCMDWGFATDKSPITMFGVVLKGNDVARKLKIRHFRGTDELPWIIEDNAFSNFFQAPRQLKKPVVIQPADTLSLECTYNTTARQGITRGGWSRVEELCRATVFYYPAKPFDMCLSWSSYDKLKNTKGELVPENETVDYLGNVTSWDAPMRRLYKEALAASSERSICSSITRQPAYAIDRFNLPKLTKVYRKPVSCPRPKFNRRMPIKVNVKTSTKPTA